MLLILAVVAIGAVQDDGIIDHAKNARQEYGAAQSNENTTLSEYLGKIEANLPQNAGTGTGGNQGTTITFTINGTQYTADNGMNLKQWAESDYDIEDNFKYIEKGGYVGKMESDGGHEGVYSDAELNEFAPVNEPIVAGSAFYYHVEAPTEPEETITFYYNGEEYTANKGDSWENWSGYGQAGCTSEDGYLMWNERLVCYDDGTWVKTDDEIRERILLYRTV